MIQFVLLFSSFLFIVFLILSMDPRIKQMTKLFYVFVFLSGINFSILIYTIMIILTM
ncbi:hypothetical protein [Evansella cellulosilytica]|uniref:NADH dehydrogenase subunit 4L n=1 Tax=Evansella cellulosilytica (strain ATCC 21833 / DSM 2522 / FERM P-1141 / JCM 9156 / N-4) TaxID=649639 RepID=E6TZ08_EVAC2|nr:hypothetical protein [Evansella cellulosilytica]ADU32451.1 hypothetical protein Bcell_4224 [Evansella cellulosilytica DSM 2522]